MKDTPLYPSPEVCLSPGRVGLGTLENNGYTQFERDRIRDIGVREAYSDYLQSFSWDYYLTVTFRKPWRDRIYAHQAVWSVLVGECGAKRAFCAVEKHGYPSKDVHVHAIVSGYEETNGYSLLLPWHIWDRLFHRFGRSDVQAIRSAEDVTAYCSKYVVKRMSDYAFYGAPSFWEK